jgi:type II secretory pathway component PulF
VGASDIVKQYGLIILIAVITIIIGLRRLLDLEEGKRFFEQVILALPVLGRITANFALVRFSRMLGTLTGAGVPLVTALKVSNESIGNQTLSDTVNQAIKKVQNGASLASSMATCPKLFPPSVIEMISISEESGGVDQGLVHIASSYEETLDRELSALVAMVEPALLFLMAIVVAVIIIGMLLPIFSLQELIH